MNNKIFGILLFVVFSILTFYKFNFYTLLFSILIIIYLLFTKNYKLILVNLSIFLIIIISNIQYSNNKSININLDSSFKVSEVNLNYSIVEQNNNKYIIYQDDFKLKEGNIIKFIDPKIKEINDNGIPYLFSFKDYLNNKKIYYQIDFEKIEIVSNNVKTQTKIIDSILERINYSKDYLNLLLFNNKSDSLNIFYDSLIKISAVQLFVISGFHISFLKNLLDKVINKITKKEDNNISVFILFIYIYLLNFALSSLRAFLSIILNKINKKYKLNYNSLDINSFIALLFIIISPKIIFSIGFQLSFIIVITICIIGNIKSKTSKILMVIIPFFIALPIVINMNSEIGVINVFMNFILTPLVSVIYVLGIITLIFPFLDLYLYYIIIGFNTLIDIFINYNLYIIFPYISVIGIIIYYFIIYKMLLNIYLNKKIIINILSIFVFLLCWYLKPISSPYIIFLDVGQGDSCLIHGKNNKYNILIDTGGNKYSDIAIKKLIPYFNKEGIKKLDLVIISHLDFDHYGALESLKNNFKVERVIDNNYENIYYKDLSFKNLNTFYSSNDDENTKSSVLLFNFLGLTFLLTGDAPKEIENKIINTYDLDIDVLKVGHHGSNTSTSNKFIESIKPEVAIISCGKNNIYGHPHSEVINALIYNKVVIFRTDYDGSIKISKNILNDLIIYTKL